MAKASFSADNVKIQRFIVNIRLVPKKYIERRHFKFLFLSKMGLLGSQASTFQGQKNLILKNTVVELEKNLSFILTNQEKSGAYPEFFRIDTTLYFLMFQR